MDFKINTSLSFRKAVRLRLIFCCSSVNTNKQICQLPWVLAKFSWVLAKFRWVLSKFPWVLATCNWGFCLVFELCVSRFYLCLGSFVLKSIISDRIILTRFFNIVLKSTCTQIWFKSTCTQIWHQNLPVMLSFWEKSLSFQYLLEFFCPWVFWLQRKNKPGLVLTQSVQYTDSSCKISFYSVVCVTLIVIELSHGLF